METLTFGKCTKTILKKTFGLRQIWQSEQLDAWLTIAETQKIDAFERELLTRLQHTLIRRVDDWNEAELSEYFIGPIIALIDFNTEYFSAFTQRPLETEIGDYKLMGKPDMLVAKGETEPEIPYVCFQEYKKQIDPEGNPVYQALGEMLAARELNPHSHPIYGVGVIGKLWHFILLDGHDYVVSPGFLADGDDLFSIVTILKGLKGILVEIARQDAEGKSE